MGKRRGAVEGLGLMDEMQKFYGGKKVFVTGHTGFKGLWLTKMLLLLEAKVTGYALPPTGETAKVWAAVNVTKDINSVFGDVRDLGALQRALATAAPELVIHLAAQPLVRESYRDPVGTIATNVMGTTNLLEGVRQTAGVKSVLIVTTDKVYDNREWCWGYRETDLLGGRDPYAASKAMAELVTASYKQSLLPEREVAVSTARAGNVIGGGDFAPERIIPDCLRAAYAGETIRVRNPQSVRPYQHVLEPLDAYLQIMRRQYEDGTFAGSYNVGPGAADCLTTGELADLFCAAWGEGISWRQTADAATAPEANFLRLDCAKIKAVLNWRPRWNAPQAVQKTVEWGKAYRAGSDMGAIMAQQIGEYYGG